MAQDHKRRNPPQMYRRFETMWTRKMKESENERTRESEWWWKKEKEEENRDFLDHGLFFQPDSEFGRLVDILRILVHTLSDGW